MRLHKAVQKIVTGFNGDVIAAMKQYTEIPGIGPYTAQAVQIFSTNADLVAIDTNIRRIFIAEFHLSEDVSIEQLRNYAAQCLPLGRSREWHNALMDYGALHLTARKTKIHSTSQQSKFEGSDRQIRAAVIYLLLNDSSSFENLHRTLDIEPKKLRKILDKMIDEEILFLFHKKYKIKE